MPFLDWKGLPVRLDVKVLSEVKSELTVSFQKKDTPSLLSHLGEIFLHQAGELRWALPQDWVLFWKPRSEGNKALLAHPNAQEWVGTIALDPECAQKFLQLLADLEPGKSILLSELGSFGSFSNLELRFACQHP